MVCQTRRESVRLGLAREIDRAALVKRTFQLLFGLWAGWEGLFYLPHPHVGAGMMAFSVADCFSPSAIAMIDQVINDIIGARHRGVEVDFLIGDHMAVEAKVKANVMLRDVTSLRALSEDKQCKRYLCV